MSYRKLYSDGKKMARSFCCQNNSVDRSDAI